MSFCLQCGRYVDHLEKDGLCPSCRSEDHHQNTQRPRDSSKELVLLDSLDGFEFEEVCKRILEKLGYGRVENVQPVSDEGRDLIVHGSGGDRIVVECKHHPRSTIGRPTVQKLHSATLSTGARKAMLITTGRFSPAALEYSKRIGDIGIEMIDQTKLLDLADRAGIRLATTETPFPVTTYYVSDLNILTKKMLILLIPVCLSSPNRLADLLRIKPKRLKLKSVYITHFNIHQDFETSVGTIWSIHSDGQTLVIDAAEGKPLPDETAGFVMNNIEIDTAQIPKFTFSVDRQEFSIGLSSIKDHAKNLITQQYARNVSYYGRNNVRYVKRCTPNPSSILITDIKQTYYPEWETDLNILKKDYRATFLENQYSILKLRFDLDTCVECGQKIEQNMLICNSCGNVAHPPRRLWSHSQICRECGKTLCKQCTYWTRQWLLFKRKICRECGMKLQTKGMKINKLLA